MEIRVCVKLVSEKETIFIFPVLSSQHFLDSFGIILTDRAKLFHFIELLEIIRLYYLFFLFIS